MPDASRRPRWQVVGIGLLIGATGFAVWFATRPEPPAPPPDPDTSAPVPDPPPPDPRLTFDTPFRNVRPGVRYVGDARCADCHADTCASYHAHPMGRSAEVLANAAPVEKFDSSAHPTFPAGAFELWAEETPGGMRHGARLREPAPAPVGEYVVPAHVAIGSGTRGRSYLTVADGAVWQTPVSWFGPERRWNLSPGFRLGVSARRAIGPACLHCHVNHVEPIPGAENRYREPLFAGQAAIGCERCHGPGELHAAERSGAGRPGGIDTSIVNPRHLSPPLQLAICEQCHLQGEERVVRRGRDLFEFRPGLPFELFASVYVRHPDIAEANRSVGQFEQVEQSRCFSGSRGQLVCTSCHDPHYAPAPAARDEHYRQKCLTCHQSRGCSLPAPERQAKQDSCVACHMPKSASANIAHASVTDHRIPRTPSAARPAPRGLPPGALPLVRFRTGPLSPPRDEQERDLGIALSRFAPKSIPKGVTGGELRRHAIERLRGSLTLWPGDAEAWGALATAHGGAREAAEKLEAARAAVALAPESDSALVALVEAATLARQFDLALEASAKRVRLNPTSTDPLLGRALVHLARGDWVKAEEDARAAIRTQPLHPEARLYLAICLNRRGDPEAGLREVQTAARLESDPREQAYLMSWYRQATR